MTPVPFQKRGPPLVRPSMSLLAPGLSGSAQSRGSVHIEVTLSISEAVIPLHMRNSNAE
jgi:hypothetical protein